MIVKTQDLTGTALVYMLYVVEDGEQHRGSRHMWYFPRRKLSILKSAWRPWELKAQAVELLEDHQLCVWHDEDGWHGGSYTSVTGEPVFFDAPNMALAICLAAIGKHCGERIDIPNEMLVESRRKPSAFEVLLAQSNGKAGDVKALAAPLETLA